MLTASKNQVNSKQQLMKCEEGLRSCLVALKLVVFVSYIRWESKAAGDVQYHRSDDLLFNFDCFVL